MPAPSTNGRVLIALLVTLILGSFGYTFVIESRQAVRSERLAAIEQTVMDIRAAHVRLEAKLDVLIARIGPRMPSEPPW